MKIEQWTLDIAQRANIELRSDAESISINHKLNRKNNVLWGILFLLCAGIFFMVASFIDVAADSKIIGLVVGLPLTVFLVLLAIKIKKDYLMLDANALSYCYNLRTASLPRQAGLLLQMEARTIRSRRSDFTNIILYVKKTEGLVKVFDFQMDHINDRDAKNLGKAILRLFNQRLAS